MTGNELVGAAAACPGREQPKKAAVAGLFPSPVRARGKRGDLKLSESKSSLDVSSGLLMLSPAHIPDEVWQEPVSPAVEPDQSHGLAESLCVSVPVLPVEEPAPPSLASNDSEIIGNPGAIVIPEAAAKDVSQSLFAATAEEEPFASTFLDHYGLSQQPFDVTPDPAFLYLSAIHREALSSLLRGIENLRGFLALVAEPGMGKTTLLNKLMEELGDSARVVFLFQTQCSSRELLGYLISELGVDHSGMDLVAMHRTLNQALFQEMLLGKRFVLIIDEAQNLDDSALETIRLLSDFETSHSKLIQIVLAGQHQLVDTLLRPGLSQLRQRIATVANLRPLSAEETSQYVRHRLRTAGSNAEAIFTPGALASIAELSEGIPRRINNLCFDALMAGYSEKRSTIESAIVRKVATYSNLESLSGRMSQEAATDSIASPAVLRIQPQTLVFPPHVSSREVQPAPGPCSSERSEDGIVLTGKLTQKLRSRGWSKEGEFRLEVTLERHGQAEIPVADRYFCCTLFVGEDQAANLRVGQPVRLRIDQD
jgi:type II secretory pathway predicted ATPase ExeA